MWGEIYTEWHISQNFEFVEFESIGKNGNIRKRVNFIPGKQPDRYSLEFGDVTLDGRMDFYSVADNGDRDKILATVARVVEAYTGRFPERWVYFYGSTKERTRLYRMAIACNLEKFTELFTIYAEVDKGMVPFRRNIELTGFWVKRKEE